MPDPSDVINWRRVNDRITLSGQPTEEQLAEIRDLGVTHVINLGPHHNKGALPDEAASVAALGMEYIYIPVEFETPTDDDYAQFCDAMAGLKDRVVHVHCIYNARVSAFMYRYACDGNEMPKDIAFDMMDGIWRPGADWADFIGDPAAKSKANRYAGYDY